MIQINSNDVFFTTVASLRCYDFREIPVNCHWNTSADRELRIHRIHAYPAKFPAFITAKAIELAKEEGIKVNWIADVFCGCGTVAFEARRHGINFWGCDLNPVATLIAKTKSFRYKPETIKAYLNDIESAYKKCRRRRLFPRFQNARLKYWFTDSKLLQLQNLKLAIDSQVPKSSPYRDLFHCAFSNILKPTSRWLTKSIKPQIDPRKRTLSAITNFKIQCQSMATAYEQKKLSKKSKVQIYTLSLFDLPDDLPRADLIITSPPYVTSYEYADLHQLSLLWLEYCADYRDMRKGSVGSLYHNFNFARESKDLNETGNEIVFRLIDKDRSKATAVAKYFLDMQQAVRHCHNHMATKSCALFVVGNTEYKGELVDNAKHLSEAMLQSGFRKIRVARRQIQNKILTPYRDKNGRFTDDETGRKVYGDEYVVVGYK